jgi:hypothetical protein
VISFAPVRICEMVIVTRTIDRTSTRFRCTNDMIIFLVTVKLGRGKRARRDEYAGQDAEWKRTMGNAIHLDSRTFSGHVSFRRYRDINGSNCQGNDRRNDEISSHRQ